MVALNTRSRALGIALLFSASRTGGKLKLKRIGVVAAVVAAGALALSGCSAGSGDTSEIVKGTSITVAQNAAFASYNSNTGNGNSVYNGNVTYMTNSWFYYYNNTPKLVMNTKFGTETMVSKSPLTVKYTINPGVKWSDGAPVTAADLYLNWATQLTKFNGATKDGPNFTSAAFGAAADTTKATLSSDGQSMTLVYSSPYVDWQLLLSTTMLPAHVVYNVAMGTNLKAAAANKAIVTAIKSNDTAKMTKIASTWSTGFDMTSTPSNKKLILSDGPYKIDAIAKGASISLVPNTSYTWGPKPKIARFTFRVIPDPTAQVQALQNGEVSVIYGQADADTASALKSSSGVSSSTTPSATYEHVDLVFNNGGPFDPKTYGGDAQKALDVREAFLKTIPRQEILDKLIHPIAPNEKLDDSQLILPGAAGYSESVAQNGSADYANVDIAGAKALLAKAGVKTVNVKFLYGKSNTRRQQEYALIKASAAQAGINVIDDGNDDWPSLLGHGSYDASLFAFNYTSLAVTAGQPIFSTGGGSNYQGYSNPAVDSEFTKLQSTYDQSGQSKILATVDKQLWSDAVGVTIFQFPDVNGWSSNVKNVSDNPLSPGIFWNFFDWTQSKSK
jgi:peptide/nickel transport system substrate-binding protein